MATHSSVLAWRIPGTGELGGLPSMGSHRVGHDWSNLVVVILFILKLVVSEYWGVFKYLGNLACREGNIHAGHPAPGQSFRCWHCAGFEAVTCVLLHAGARPPFLSLFPHRTLENIASVTSQGHGLPGGRCWVAEGRRWASVHGIRIPDPPLPSSVILARFLHLPEPWFPIWSNEMDVVTDSDCEKEGAQLSVLKEIVETYQVQSGDPASPSPVPSTCYVVQGFTSLRPQVTLGGAAGPSGPMIRGWGPGVSRAPCPVFTPGLLGSSPTSCFACSLSFCRIWGSWCTNGQPQTWMGPFSPEDTWAEAGASGGGEPQVWMVSVCLLGLKCFLW